MSGALRLCRKPWWVQSNSAELRCGCSGLRAVPAKPCETMVAHCGGWASWPSGVPSNLSCAGDVRKGMIISILNEGSTVQKIIAPCSEAPIAFS